MSVIFAAHGAPGANARPRRPTIRTQDAMVLTWGVAGPVWNRREPIDQLDDTHALVRSQCLAVTG
jgi:hypothetical protein